MWDLLRRSYFPLVDEIVGLVHGDCEQQPSIQGFPPTKSTETIKAALDNGSYPIFPKTLYLPASIAARFQGQVCGTYIDLLQQRFPYIRRIFCFQDIQDPDEDNFEEEVRDVAYSLLDLFHRRGQARICHWWV